MYIHPDSITAKTVPVRCGIVGPPGSGKTTAACTFPNPLIGNIDCKAPPGVPCIPLSNPDFARKVLDPKFVATPATRNIPANFRDSTKKWMRENVPALPADVTFIIDSWTFLQNFFSIQAQDDIIYRKYDDKNKAWVKNMDGSFMVDKWDILRHRIVYSSEILGFLRQAVCQSVVTFHEQIERNDAGLPTGNIKALMDGQFKDQITGHFTLFVRQVVIHFDTFTKQYQTDAAYYKNYYEAKYKESITPKTPCYVWQVVSSDIFNALTPPGFKSKWAKYMPADYNEYAGAIV